MKLIIGANGLIGRRVGNVLSEHNTLWVGTRFKREESPLIYFDTTHSASVSGIFQKLRPSVVYFCANLGGGVNFCEQHPDSAKKFHVESVILVGEACQKIDAKLVFISSDYVFDGTEIPSSEEGIPNPLNVYGKYKLLLEEWIQANLKKYIIVRTTNVYGWDPLTKTPNFMMQLYRSIERSQSISASVHLFGNPTYVGDLARAMVELDEKDARGIFHLVGPDYVNRYEWACAIAERFNWPTSLIERDDSLPNLSVKRPLTSHLNCDKFKSRFKTPLHHLNEGLDFVYQDMKRIIN